MHFVVLVKFRQKPTKKHSEEHDRYMADAAKKGVKVLHAFMTLGHYDMVWIAEAPDEKVALQVLQGITDIASTETLVAVSRDVARHWLP